MSATGDPFTACEEAVRRHDPDRYFAALFTPKRRALFALYAFHHEIARVAQLVHEPMLGAIRLQWWRETLEAARAGKPRAHDVARALAVTLAEHDLPFENFDRMIAAREDDLAQGPFEGIDAVEDYADATSGGLMRLAAQVLGGADEALARQAGIAYGVAGLLRIVPFHAVQRTRHLPARLHSDALSLAGRTYEQARGMRTPGERLAAYMPAALVPLYLRNADPPLWRKQIVYLHAAMTGRV